MGMVQHFQQECELLGWNDVKNFDDQVGYDMQQLIMNNVIQVLEVIAAQGHSGLSMSVFKQLLNNATAFKPLSPLTGEDNEWNDVSEMSGEELYQNKRDSRIFKDATHSFNIEHYVFEEPDGITFTNHLSLGTITFPYDTLEPIFVKVPFDATDEQITELLENMSMTAAKNKGE